MTNEIQTITASPVMAFNEEWIDRFWSRFQKQGDCLVWTGATAGKRYGVTCTKSIEGIEKKQEYIHRIAWMIDNGPIPDGMFILHTCDNPPCGNPDHLFLGTPKDNVDDMIRKGRKGNVARITDREVREIRQSYRDGGVTFFDLADAYGISFQHAHAIVRGARRANVS